MNAEEAAELYVRGMILRPGESYREWEKFGLEQDMDMVRTFPDHGCEFRSIQFLYTATVGFTAQIEMERTGSLGLLSSRTRVH